MRYSSLGLIETEGLVGTIEAADAAVKAANVELVSCEYATGGLVTIVFTGGLGDVQAAVEAGATAAARVGQLIAQRVIAAPHDDLRDLLGIAPHGLPDGPPHMRSERNGATLAVAPAPTVGFPSSTHPHKEKTLGDLPSVVPSPPPAPAKARPTPEEEAQGNLPPAGSSIPAASAKARPTPSRTTSKPRRSGSSAQPRIEEMRVSALRHYARTVPGIDLHGREISRATRAELIRSINRARQKSSS